MNRYTNITDTTEVAIDRVSEGTEFVVMVQGDFNSGNLAIQYNRGDGTYATFSSGTLSAAGETVFTTATSDLRMVASVSGTDLHVLVEELRFRGIK